LETRIEKWPVTVKGEKITLGRPHYIVYCALFRHRPSYQLYLAVFLNQCCEFPLMKT